jgi:oxygen-dependent protoporphyrinogen oxidase
MTAAVIGGGIAGLTAAYQLVKLGERPYLIEPQDPPGGMVASSQVDGFTVEKGPNVLVERPDLKALLTDLRLSGDVVYPSVNPYGQYVWFRNRARKVPTGIWEFLTSPLFTLQTKLTLPFNLFRTGVLPSSIEDCSVACFFRELLGSHTTSNLLDPVLKGIYGGDVDLLSARTLFPALWSAAQRRESLFSYMRTKRRAAGGSSKPPIMVLRGGIASITNALWRELEPHVMRVRSRARRVHHAGDKRYRIALEGGGEIEADGCILAVAGASLASLVESLDEPLALELAAMRYASLCVVNLSAPITERLIPRAFGVLFPGGMPLNLLGVMFNSQIFPHVAPPGMQLITAVLGGAQMEERSFNELELREHLPALLDRFLGIKRPTWLAKTEWNAAIPQLVVGHHQIVSALDRFEVSNPGLVCIGVDRGGVGVSDRIRIAGEGVARFRSQRIETAV